MLRAIVTVPYMMVTGRYLIDVAAVIVVVVVVFLVGAGVVSMDVLVSKLVWLMVVFVAVVLCVEVCVEDG